jgi:hypothetical protein
VARWGFTAERRTRRLLRRARVSRIADLVDGRLVCVVGKVELDAEQIPAMMSGRPCVAFDTRAEYLENNGFVRIETVRRMVPFFVVDDSGRARVDAPQAALSNRPIPMGVRATERIIEAGMTIRLVGCATLEPTDRSDREHGFRDAGTKATITGTAKYPLLIDAD